MRCPVCNYYNIWCCSCGVNYIHKYITPKLQQLQRIKTKED